MVIERSTTNLLSSVILNSNIVLAFQLIVLTQILKHTSFYNLVENKVGRVASR